MRIHHLQHVPFEALGSMESYFRSGGHTMTSTHLYRGDRLPDINNLDFLIIMGGPMGVSDEAQYPYLTSEKAFIKTAINSGKTVLGICLGAQLIADVLGAGVKKNTFREIGWFPLTRAPEIQKTTLDSCFPQFLDVFHWHGDRFEIPDGALPLASSMACDNQGFIIDDRIVGFQFHLETTEESARSLISHCADDLDGSPFVQTGPAMLADPRRFDRINQVMHSVLQSLEKTNF